MNERLENINAIRVVMMLVIVLYHSMIFFGGQWIKFESPFYNANYIVFLAKLLNTFHIQTFCMISGFLFYYMKIEKNRYKNKKEEIIKRSKRLLIPYIFSCIFWVIPIAIIFNNYSIQEIIIKYVLMESPNQLWFLIMLFFVFLVFLIFSDKIKISFKNLVCMYLFSTSIGYLLELFGFNYFQIAKVIQFILFFYLGGYIYINKDKISLKQSCVMTLIFIITYVFNFYFNSLGTKKYHYIAKFFLVISSLCEVSMVYIIITYLVRKKLLNVNGIIYKLVCEYNFGIYLFHQQIIYFTIVLLNGKVYPALQVIISFSISLITSILMSKILKKFKYTRFMFGL